jgi:hypothetical protein
MDENFILQSQVITFAWSSIIQWDVDDEGMVFAFQYQRPDKPARWVRIFTLYVSLDLLIWPLFYCKIRNHISF